MTKPSGVVHRQMFEQMEEQRDGARVRIVELEAARTKATPAFNADCDRECSAIFYKKGYSLPVKHSEFCPHYAAPAKEKP